MEKFKMKNLYLSLAVFALALGSAAGQAKKATNDPLTGLPVSPAVLDGEPDKMPNAQVCKSKMQGDFYSLSSIMNPGKAIKMDAAGAWYASHLSGFTKVQGYESGRSQIAFYNADRTILIFLTGQAGENTGAYSVAYERYQPGLSEKTIVGMTRGKMVCN
jgi:hypothetical protein